MISYPTLQTLTVHFFKVLAVLTAQDVLPPIFIIQIPLNGLSNAGIEVVYRLPAQLSLQLGRIDGVTHIVTGTVGYKVDQALRLIQSLQDGLNYFQVGALVMAAYIVNLAYTTLVNDQVDGSAVVIYM